MKRAVLVAICTVIVVVTVAASAQTLPEPRLARSDMPTYPPVAAQARIEGTVKMSFVLNRSGEVESVEVASGHPMLKSAAASIVKTCRFELPRDLFRAEWRYETEFVFRLSGKEVQANPKLVTTWKRLGGGPPRSESPEKTPAQCHKQGETTIE